MPRRVFAASTSLIPVTVWHPHMTIITMTPKGTLKLPAEIVKHLRSAKHLQVRENAHGITLTPVAIHRAGDLQEIPDSKGGKTK